MRSQVRLLTKNTAGNLCQLDNSCFHPDKLRATGIRKQRPFGHVHADFQAGEQEEEEEGWGEQAIRSFVSDCQALLQSGSPSYGQAMGIAKEVMQLRKDPSLHTQTAELQDAVSFIFLSICPAACSTVTACTILVYRCCRPHVL
jgi:hypothetical protein